VLHNALLAEEHLEECFFLLFIEGVLVDLVLLLLFINSDWCQFIWHHYTAAFFVDFIVVTIVDFYITEDALSSTPTTSIIDYEWLQRW